MDELLPVNFSQYVDTKATLAKVVGAPQKSKSDQLLAQLKEKQNRLALLKLKEQALSCRRSVLATQINLKNIKINKETPQIVS